MLLPHLSSPPPPPLLLPTAAVTAAADDGWCSSTKVILITCCAGWGYLLIAHITWWLFCKLWHRPPHKWSLRMGSSCGRPSTCCTCMCWPPSHLSWRYDNGGAWAFSSQNVCCWLQNGAALMLQQIHDSAALWCCNNDIACTVLS